MNDALVAYSVLKTFHDERRDLLESFLPFVEYAIVRSSATYVPVVDLQQNCVDAFGICFPLSTLKSLLKKLNRVGKIKPLKGYEFIEVLTDGPDTIEDFKQRMDSATRRRNQLIDDFRDFAENSALDDRTVLTAMTKLIDACLGTIDPLQEDLRALVGDPAIGTFARFVEHIRERNSLAFDTFKDVYFGAILSKQTTPAAIDSANRSVRSLTVYLDSNTLFRVLELQNPVHNHSSMELLNMLNLFEFDIRCLLATVDEMRRVLRHRRELIASSKVPRAVSQEEAEHTDGILGAIYRARLSLSDLDALIQNLELRIERAGVKVDHSDQLAGATPPAELVDSLFKIKLVKAVRRQPVDETYYDPVEIESVREDAVPQWLKDSIQKKAGLDARVIHWVGQKRGLTRYGLADARVVFLSCDKLLSQHSAAWSPDGAVPEVFLEEQFTTLLWLARPEVAAEVPLDLALSAFSASHFIDYRVLRSFKEYLEKYSGESPDNLQLIGDVFANQELVARLKATEYVGPDEKKAAYDDILEYAKQLTAERFEDLAAQVRELDGARETAASLAEKAERQVAEVSQRLNEMRDGRVAERRRFANVVYYGSWTFAIVLMAVVARGDSLDVFEALFVPRRIDYTVIVARAFPELLYIFIFVFLSISYRDTIRLVEAYARDDFPQFPKLAAIVVRNILRSAGALITVGVVPLIRQVFINKS